jgi:hypothetical protein
MKKLIALVALAALCGWPSQLSRRKSRDLVV